MYKLNKLILFIIFNTLPASSSEDCFCEAKNWQGECNASISSSNDWVTIKTNTNKCTRVDWYGNETPQVTIVTEGSFKEKWHGRTLSNLEITSCNICLSSATQERTNASELKHQHAPTTDYIANCSEPVVYLHNGPSEHYRIVSSVRAELGPFVQYFGEEADGYKKVINSTGRVGWLDASLCNFVPKN